MCSFCDQKAISGETKPPVPEEIAEQCRESLAGGIDGKNSEIAFFGGSFTAIPRNNMLSYLEAVQPFLGENGFSGVRISTRPDAVPDEILHILKEHGVTAIELGAQSMSDGVLTLNRRGHSAQDVRKASERIKAHGFSLGLQMMYGLYGSGAEDEEYTLSECISLRPDTMRIYPTVVLDGTHLGELYKSGQYILPSWDDMITFTSKAVCRLKEESISLIRLGLHAEKELESRILAGFYHPALSELVQSRLYLNAMKQWAERNKDILRDNAGKSTYVLAEVQTGRAGLAAGHGKANRKAFAVRMRISENRSFSDGMIRLSLCISDETGTVKRIGEEVYDVFKITGTSGL